jgi:hypothetical protein
MAGFGWRMKRTWKADCCSTIGKERMIDVRKATLPRRVNMDYRVDEKGKYYTTRVTKRTVQVVIATATHIVRGTMYVMPDSRLKDDLNSNEHFIAVTDAEVFDASGNTRLYHNDVLMLNKDQIVWMLPQEEKQSGGEEGTREPPQ